MTPAVQPFNRDGDGGRKLWGRRTQQSRLLVCAQLSANERRFFRLKRGVSPPWLTASPRSQMKDRCFFDTLRSRRLRSAFRTSRRPCLINHVLWGRFNFGMIANSRATCRDGEAQQPRLTRCRCLVDSALCAPDV